jgi:kumamolisin
MAYPRGIRQIVGHSSLSVIPMRAAVLFLVLGIVLPNMRAAAAGSVPLSHSIQAVDGVPPSPAEPHKAYISRGTLRPDELAQTLNFEVVLQMRNFSELQGRVAKGERISVAEMASKYQPAAADYQTIVNWLTQQGFTIRKQDPNHLAVFASGKVSELKTKLSMTFARVTQDGTEYTSAISAPVVPTTIGNVLVGINGLQPHLRMHHHIVNSVSGAGAPFEPSQLAQAYDATTLYNDNITGSGQTIAIVIDALPAMSDLTEFWTDFGVNRGSSTVTFIQVVAGTLPAPSAEETLDTEWSSSIAPGANVRVYATLDLEFSDTDQGYAQVYSDVTTNPSLNIHQMSMSYGAAEYYEADSQLTTDDQYFAELTAAGVTVFASSGDEGASPSSSGNANGRHATPENPASDPYVTGVGGTSLTVDANGNESSEVVWNDSAISKGATGGGVSTFFAKPSWQTGTGVSTTANRQVPDIAAAGDPETGAYVILNGQGYEYGGTSWSSPTWAGFCALLNQARANTSLGSLGLLGPYLYPLIGTANFRDITSGNNDYESSRGFGYSAGTGYDLCTGCGVPDVTVLAKTLSGSTTLAPNLVSVASVQSQGGTNYSIPLPLTGTEGVECRRVNGSLQLVFTFVQPVVSGDAEVTDGTGTVSNVTFSGDTMTVSLTDVTDVQDLTVAVEGINGTDASDSVTFGVLLGDVNGDGIVNATDFLLELNDSGFATGQSGFNFRADVSCDGIVNALDFLIVRNRSGFGLQ